MPLRRRLAQRLTPQYTPRMDRICPTRSTTSLSPLGPPAGRTRSRTAILAGNTPFRPDYYRAARSGFAAPAAQALPPKTPPRSSPLPRSDRLGSTTPLDHPGSCRPLPAQNTQMYHTTLEGDACAATKQLSNTLLSYSHRDWDKAQRAYPLCDATRRYIQLGRPDPPPLSLRSLALTQEAGNRRHH